MKCTRQLKSFKLFRPDNISAIIWKDKHFYKILQPYVFYLYFSKNMAQIPDITIPKKEDLSLATNDSGISLIILGRFVASIEPLLKKNRNGFRRGTSTLSQILGIRWLIEGSPASQIFLWSSLIFLKLSILLTETICLRFFVCKVYRQQ